MATITTRAGQSIPIHVNPEGGDAEPTISPPSTSATGATRTICCCS